LYHYDPSARAAVTFAAVFGLTTVIHIWQLGRNRTWYFIPFLIGCFCKDCWSPAYHFLRRDTHCVLLLVETIGYLARYASAEETPNWTTKPYIAQSLMLLLAPAFFAASIYMILGRIVRLLNGASCSLIRPSLLTKIFVTGDVLSFFIQSGGKLSSLLGKLKTAVGNLS